MSFPSNCNGRIFSVTGSRGCTLTRASIQAMTPQMFEDQDMKEVGMDKIIATSKEARMAGFRERSLTDLLMSRVMPIKSGMTRQNIAGQGSVILPYIYRRQKRLINSNYWKVTAGTPNPSAGTNGVHPGAFDITVTNNPSAYATTFSRIEKFFVPGKHLFVEYSNGTTKVAYSVQFKILASVYVSDGVAKVTVEPNKTAAGWTSLTSGEKLPYQIGGSGGGNAEPGTIALIGANSVSDYESWGGQPPSNNPISLLTYWLQTSRTSFEYNEEYLKALNAALTSGYYKNFMTLPIAEQRAQMAKLQEAELLHSAFYGQAINETQTVEGYRSLPTVTDPANPDCVIEYKANAIGFMPMLSACNRLVDKQGTALDIDQIFSMALGCIRSREADRSVNLDDEPTVDLMTDKATAGAIDDVLREFYRAKYGVVDNRNYQPGQKLTFENQTVMQYNTYQVPQEAGGFKLAVFANQYLDDRISAAGGANRQREVWGIDWSDIAMGIGEVNSVTRTTNEADELYKYVMKINKATVQLQSTKWTAIIEDPSRHFVLRNFNTSSPTKTFAGFSL